jgi:hypothetical protein
MTQLATQTSIIPGTTLSVSYKSTFVKEEFEHPAPEAVIITDAQFFIKGFNDIAASVYGLSSPTAHNKKIFKLVKFDLIGTSVKIASKTLFTNGYWNGDIIFHQEEKKSILNTRCSLIKMKQD